MADKPRFERAASNARPHGADRYDVFGPKVGRRLSLFGSAALNAWIRLEADTTVEVYCERPLLVPGSKRCADFWFRTRDSEGFIVLLKEGERVGEDEAAKLPKAVREWVDAGGHLVHLINPEEQVTRNIFLENWRWVIQDISAFSRYLPPTLEAQVVGATQNGATFSSLEEQFEEIDPVLVRVAVFSLLHKGQLACSQLERAAINESTVFDLP